MLSAQILVTWCAGRIRRFRAAEQLGKNERLDFPAIGIRLRAFGVDLVKKAGPRQVNRGINQMIWRPVKRCVQLAKF